MISRTTRLVLASCLSLAAIPFAESQDVLTYHNDIARTGQNLNETILTPGNVNSGSFGKLFTVSVDGRVDAQPLYVSGVAIPGKGTHNLLVVATEHDSVYAFDADTGASIWNVSMLKSGETTSDSRSCGQVSPEIGITSTPVIDRTHGPNGVIYIVAMSKDSSGNYFQRLHALDLATKAELFGGPVDIQATYPGTGDNSTGGTVTFDPKQYKERASLLLLNGVVYTAWASHCDIRLYTSWVIGYDASTLARTTILNLVPNGSEGGIWMSGAGLAADGAGNIYLLNGNGDFGMILNTNGFPSNGNYGNAFVKLSTSGGLAVADYFEMQNEVQENAADTDLGSGGALVLPDLMDNSGTVWHLAVGAGKDSHIYLVNRDSMGKFNVSTNNVYQDIPGALPGGIWSMPAYFNNRIYYGSVGYPIYAFQFSNGKLSTASVSQTGNTFGYPGTTPSVSANNNTNGIVWATENTSPAVLHAYDASNLQELYNSNQASGGRDHFGAGNKFITPTIANAKVYVATTTGVGAFGLLNVGVSPPTFSPLGGTYGAAQAVTLSTTTSGASIHYTTDGTTPTSTTGTLYSGAIVVSTTTTIKAIAYKAGMTDSAVSTAVYTINLPVVAAPTFSPVAGTYTSAQSVTISTTTAGASIRYTTDSTTPTSTTGTLYSAAIAVSSTTTIKAIAYASGMTDSSVSSATYTINLPVVAAYWKLDEGSGATSFADASGNGNNGTCGSSCPTMGVPGKLGTAASFNGINSQITVPDAPSLRLNRFTIALWVYPTQLKTNFQPLVVKEDSFGNNRNYGLFIVPNSMQIRYAAWGSDCVTRFAASSVGQLALNTWSHIVFTYDGTVEKLYLNGVLDSSNAASSGALCQTPAPVKVGMETSAFLPFNGTLDEVRIYSQALSAAGVLSLYNPPAAYWKLDEPSGATSFADASGNGNNGTCGSSCPTIGVPGKLGTAASFNGINSQITIPDSPALRLNQFTIALWVYPTQLKTNFQPLVVKEDSFGNNRNYGLFIVPNSMQIRYAAWGSDCVTRFAASSVGQLALNTWSHIVFTYDGTVEKLYLNGVLDSSNAASSGALCQTPAPVKVGMEISAFLPFNGTLDEVQIYSQALSAAGVLSLYNGL